MKIVIVTQDEPFYIPKLLKKFTDSLNTTAIILLPGVPHGFTQFTYYKRLFDIFGLFAVVKYGFLFLYRKFMGFYTKIRDRGEFTIEAIAYRKKIPIININNINSSKSVKKINELHPNVIISIASPQIFKPDIINSADYVINIHAALLPEYRGMMPCYWILSNGEKITGITVHMIDSNIDTGKILLQKEIAIEKDETFHSLNNKVADISADLLIEVIQYIQSDSISFITPKGTGSYFSFPTKEAAKELRSRGRKII